MAWHARLVRRLRGVLSRTDDAEVQAELQSHIDLLTDEYCAAGLPPDEARARAERALGNRTRLAEQTRAVTTYPWLEGLLKDVAFGARQLRRAPSVTLLALASLAIGIGANTAVFSVVNALALRTLPVPDADRLAALSLGEHDVTRVDGSRWSFAFWRAFSSHLAQFDGAFAWSHNRMLVTVNDTAETVDGAFVSGSFFTTLRVPMVLGRQLTPEDDNDGAPAVAVISYGYWQRQFGGRADALGRSVTLQDAPLTIVGVMPASFTGLEVGQAPELVLPLSAEPRLRGAQSFTRPPFDAMNMWLRIGVRLKDGQSLTAGSAVVRALQPQLREAALPPGFPQLRETLMREPMGLVGASTGLSRLRQLYRLPLDVLRVVVALVLLLACLNVANLLLSQTTARSHELGVRLALGGSRWRVARQLLVEAALLAFGGVVIGSVVAQWVARALVAQFSTPTAPVTLDLGIDWRVFGATALAGIVTILICGSASALRVNAVAPAHALADAARGVVSGGRPWASGGLLTLQLGLSLTLVVGAGLFVGTFVRLTSVSLGFDRDSVLIVSASTGRTETAPSERPALYQRLTEAAQAVPGVARAAASNLTPVSTPFAPVVITPPPGAGTSGSGEATSVFVTPGWFATYGLPVLAGRDIDRTDVAGAAPVMIVNRAFVDRFFSGRDPLGDAAGIAVGTRGEFALPARTIVGVVGNAIYRSLREPSQPTVFIPLAQYDYPVPMNAFINISVRPAVANPLSLVKDVTTALSSIAPRLTLTHRTLRSQVEESIRQEQVLAEVSAVFGAIALFLASMGLFGVTSYGVSRRRREIAVRIAVGATRGHIIRTVLSRAAVPLALGVALGVTLSTWLARFASALFFGVGPGDLTTMGLGAAVLVATALLAAWIPARRALRISPVETLRAS